MIHVLHHGKTLCDQPLPADGHTAVALSMAHAATCERCRPNMLDNLACGVTARTPAESLAAMRGVSSRFYSGAQRTGCHAFIEWTGLINEFIKACERVHQAGGDFMHANVHSGTHVKLFDYEVAYMTEKLSCIFGYAITIAPEGRERRW